MKSFLKTIKKAYLPMSSKTLCTAAITALVAVGIGLVVPQQHNSASLTLEVALSRKTEECLAVAG